LIAWAKRFSVLELYVLPAPYPAFSVDHETLRVLPWDAGRGSRFQPTIVMFPAESGNRER